MSKPVFYSFIIPLYNRPDEIKELLESLEKQTYKHFEVLVIEDGSTVKAGDVVKQFEGRLNVRYFYKPNEGQGFTRNYGFARARGDYFIILDSDVILPPHYLETVDKHIRERKLDAFGGPDAAHPSFTPVQKAISYVMTSFLTTGGTRGRKKHLGAYHPRSFNMGISREVWEKTGGFKITRLGEDLEFSMRIIKMGFRTGLIEDAYVYHKRRTDFKRFYHQLKFFGRARINVATFYPDELKPVHFFPALFTLYCVLTLLSVFVNKWLFLVLAGGLLVYSLAIFIDASIQNRSVYVGLLSVIAAYIQLIGYTIGFLTEFWKRIIKKQKETVTEYPS